MHAAFELGYVTQDFPITLSDGEDLPTFKEAYESKQESGLVKHGGSILGYVHIPQVPTRPYTAPRIWIMALSLLTSWNVYSQVNAQCMGL